MKYLLTITLFLTACAAPNVNVQPVQPIAPVATVEPGQGKCKQGDGPDMQCTPGDFLPVTAADVCKKGYAGKTRNVSDAEKNAVYDEYGITNRKPGEFEIDHDASLELGGSNDIKNLWPQSYITTPWNAHVKDRYEDWLHGQVCKGKITLQDAQRQITHDWITNYQAAGKP